MMMIAWKEIWNKYTDQFLKIYFTSGRGGGGVGSGTEKLLTLMPCLHSNISHNYRWAFLGIPQWHGKNAHTQVSGENT